MKLHNTKLIAPAKQKEYLPSILALRQKVWPNFLRLEETVVKNLYERYPDQQILLINKDNNDVIGIINSVPLCWQQSLTALPATGLNWVLEKQHPDDANTWCAISATVAPAYRNQSVSRYLIERLKSLANKAGVQQLIVPLRPSLKHQFPLIDINEYSQWQTTNGSPFDPWLKVHIRLGAHLIKICPRSAVVKASIKQWQQWTGQDFPGSGDYIIDQGLAPLKIDLEKQLGEYVEPNIWLHHPLHFLSQTSSHCSRTGQRC